MTTTLDAPPLGLMLDDIVRSHRPRTEAGSVPANIPFLAAVPVRQFRHRRCHHVRARSSAPATPTSRSPSRASPRSSPWRWPSRGDSEDAVVPGAARAVRHPLQLPGPAGVRARHPAEPLHQRRRPGGHRPPDGRIDRRRHAAPAVPPRPGGSTGPVHRRGSRRVAKLSRQQPQPGTGALPEELRQPASSPPKQWWRTTSGSAPS